MKGSVLVVTSQPPLPAISGDTVRSYNVMKELSLRAWETHLFSLSTDIFPSDADLAELNSICQSVTICNASIGVARRYLRLARHLIARSAFQQDYFWTSNSALRLSNVLRCVNPDLILLNQIHLHKYVPANYRDRTVLDTHNAETLRIESMASVTPLNLRSLFARLQIAPTRKFEKAVVDSAAAVFAVSQQEHEYFHGIAPGRTTLVPNGVDLHSMSVRHSIPAEARFLFLGSLSYSANQDAFRYLLQEILVHVTHESAMMDVVGSRPPPWLSKLASSAPLPTEVHGNVKNVRQFANRNRFLVVPLRFGGGTRVKILEALAIGLPVLSTSAGCAGLELLHGQEIVVSDDPREFAKWIDRMLVDDELLERLGQNGRRVVERRYGWAKIGDAIDQSLLCVLARARKATDGNV